MKFKLGFVPQHWLTRLQQKPGFQTMDGLRSVLSLNAAQLTLCWTQFYFLSVKPVMFRYCIRSVCQGAAGNVRQKWDVMSTTWKQWVGWGAEGSCWWDGDSRLWMWSWSRSWFKNCCVYMMQTVTCSSRSYLCMICCIRTQDPPWEDRWTSYKRKIISFDLLDQNRLEQTVCM